MALLALLNASCRGPVSPTDALADSAEEFDRLTTFQAQLEATTDNGGFTVTSKGTVAYENDELAYIQMTNKAEGGVDRSSQTLLVPPDLYMQEDDGQWYVLSPWTQGMRPEEVPDLSLNQDTVNYVEMIGKLHDVEQLPDETTDGVTYLRFSGERSFDDIFGDRDLPISIEGSLDVNLWVDSDTKLPHRMLGKGEMRMRPDGENEAAEMDLSIETETVFVYNQPVIIPEVPTETRPWRDLQFPEAPCTGPEFLECLPAQDALEPVSKESCEGEGRRVCLAPMGQIDPELVRQLVEYYSAQLGLEVTVLTPLAVPAEAADSKRQQVDADSLITYFGTNFRSDYYDPEAVLIGVTPLDLYDSKSHFRYVFGVKGDYGSPRAVVSTFRMNPEFYGEQPDSEVTLTRFRKLLTKYIGMLYYGVPVSDDPASPMFDKILGPDDLDRMQEPLNVPETQ
jgi:archaemetzincin